MISQNNFSNNNYLRGSFFALANKSRLTDHFNQLTHLTNLQYMEYIEGLYFVNIWFHCSYCAAKRSNKYPIFPPFIHRNIK